MVRVGCNGLEKEGEVVGGGVVITHAHGRVRHPFAL